MDVPRPGDDDMRGAVTDLAARLPESLRALAGLAYNYRWAWTRGGRELFSAVDAHRFGLAGDDPVRFLRTVPSATLERASGDRALVARTADASRDLDAYLAGARTGAPVAFFCAEFGVHASLQIYSGGLGVLAGDILKEASDRALPFVGVGLLYRRGYFHQRLDPSGYQHEFWTEVDPELLPAVLVTRDGRPVTVEVPVWDGRIAAQVWRVDVGRVPLYLLDAAVPANPRLAQLVTARLYDGNHAIRLAQYALLGYGGARMLAALGIEPEVVHLNEGHAALATLALAHAHRGPGESMRDAIDRTRGRVVFTTHTPVAAGNETYAPDEMRDVFDGLCTELGISGDDLLGFGRVHADDVSERSGMTPLAIRAARSTNAVSERHGTVAAQMWAPMGATVTWVTNGVHAPTWISEPMHALLDTAFGRGWEAHTDDAHMWARVDDIPDTDLWAVRNALRARLVRTVRERSITDRLLRGEDLDYVLAAAEAMDDARLTVGFARRLATYKRLHLLSLEPDRALGVLPHLQFLFAGKAHPSDDGAKRVAQQLFELKGSPEVGARVAFIEDYDLSIAPVLTAGCDVWLNLPRPPLEASGTSGMKAALNGALNLSVLDGWWAEAYDGANGWAIDGSPDDDTDAQDRRDAAALFDLLERDVVPQFETRDGDGIPRAWVTRVKASLRTIGPRFNATRMLREYERDVYRLT